MPPKVAKKRARTPESDESDRDDRGKSSAKKSKKTNKPEEQHWALSKNRRVTVNDYNKQTMVNIREYYEADGEMRPGKKGISLNIDQYKQLRKHLSAIDEELLKRGEKLDDDEASEDDNDEATESDVGSKKTTKKPIAAKKATKKSPAPKKANIEATSDEESV